jgi:hypothetical protein
VDRSPRPQDISWFLDLHQRGQLDLDPPYQRKSVWTRGDKQFFLDTIFHNYPCPAVFLHKTISDDGEVSYHVVDGKQRLQTIFEFAEGQVSIPKDFGDSRLGGKRWNDLDLESKRKFWNYLITVEMLPSVEDTLVNNVFERINRNSRKLTRQELRHAKFDGWLARRAEEEAKKEEWKNYGIVTTTRARRMNDIQFISEIIIMTIKQDIIGFDQDLIDKLYAEYESPEETAPNFSEEDFNRYFEEIKSFLSHMEEENSCVSRYGKTLAHFYSLWSFVLLEKLPETKPEAIAQRYASFMEQVIQTLERVDLNSLQEADGKSKEIIRYALNVRGANTDATPRRERKEALLEVLKM